MGAKKLAIIGHKPAPHPDTTAGWAAYEVEITNWNHNNYGRATYETRLYPLTPGTSPVACGECFSCDKVGHSSVVCTADRRIPEVERIWRQDQFNQSGCERSFQECQHQCQPRGRRRRIRVKGGL